MAMLTGNRRVMFVTVMASLALIGTQNQRVECQLTICCGNRVMRGTQ